MSKFSVKEGISPAYDEYRSKTFALFQDMTKPHSLVNLILTRSAICWYLGHIAYIKSLSLQEHST
ncbi:MAG: hypothetical protein ACYTXT_34090 [Nostoc sp.]